MQNPIFVLGIILPAWPSHITILNFVGRGKFSTASLHWLWLSGGIVREKLTVSVGGLAAQCLGKGGIDLGGDGGRTKPGGPLSHTT
jgi:hypothetical protein